MEDRNAAVIGGGSTGPFDRLDLARKTAEDPSVEFLMFERMGEGTATEAAIARQADPQDGYDKQLPALIREFADFLRRGGKIVGNFGLANVDRAAEVAADALRDLGLQSVGLGVVRGDDVLQQALEDDIELPDAGCTIGELGDRVICAHVYLGAEGIREAFDQGAQLVLGGRLADHSLATGALAHHFGWAHDDWDALAIGSVVGQLLQGGCGLTGGGYADPPFRMVPDMHAIGYPIVRVEGDELRITKPKNTGGIVSAGCVKARLFHEIFDPATYLTPDVTLDISAVRVEQVDPDTVRVTGARGRPRPEALRVLVGHDLGWKTVGEVALGGARCVERAGLAEAVLRKRLGLRAGEIDDTHISLVGVNSLHGGEVSATCDPAEVVLRLALRSREREVAHWASWEMLWLYWTVAGVVPKSYGGISRAYEVLYGALPRDRVPVVVDCTA